MALNAASTWKPFSSVCFLRPTVFWIDIQRIPCIGQVGTTRIYKYADSVIAVSRDVWFPHVCPIAIRRRAAVVVYRRVTVFFRLPLDICSVDFSPIILRTIFSSFIVFSQSTPHSTAPFRIVKFTQISLFAKANIDTYIRVEMQHHTWRIKLFDRKEKESCGVF